MMSQTFDLVTDTWSCDRHSIADTMLIIHLSRFEVPLQAFQLIVFATYLLGVPKP